MHAPKTKMCVHCGAILQPSEIRCQACGKTAFSDKNPKRVASAGISLLVIGVPLGFGINYLGTMVSKNAEYQDKAVYLYRAAIIVPIIFLLFAMLEFAKFLRTK